MIARLFLLLAVCVTQTAAGAHGAASAAPGTNGREGGKIAFSSDRSGRPNVYVVNGDGRGLARVTKTGGHTPSWSPDGSAIVFASEQASKEYVYLIRADGSGQRRLAEGSDPVWSPDGTRVAFRCSQTGAASTPTCVINADGSGRRQLTHGGSVRGRPAWSPDSASLAFGDLGLFLVQTDGSGLKKLTDALVVTDLAPSWSPDGHAIAFVSGGEPHDLYVIDTSGSGQRLLAKDVEFITSRPSWSPDGGLLAFAKHLRSSCRYCQPVSEIYVVASDGTGLRRLTVNTGGESSISPAWSPDGDQIVYVRERFADTLGGRGDIYVMNRDGSGKRALTQAFPDGGENNDPQWTTGTVAVPPRPPAKQRAIVFGQANVLGMADGVGPSIAADGAWVAGERYRVFTWDGRSRRAVRDLPLGGDCDYLDALVVAGRQAAWLCSHDFADYTATSLYLAGVRSGRAIEVASGRGSKIGNLAGGGSLIVFNIGRKLWRVVPSSDHTAAKCPGSGLRRCVLIRRASGVEAAGVSDGRIVGWRGDRLLVVLRADGTPVVSLRLDRSTVRGLRLDGLRLAVVEDDTLFVYDLSRGHLGRRLRLFSGMSAGAELQAVGEGLAVYVSGVAIHVIRLIDGRDVVLRIPNEGPPAQARLTTTGLFYSYNETYSRRSGRVVFVPMKALLRAVA